MSAAAYVLIAAALGATWRRWLGAAGTGPRAVKVAVGALLFGKWFGLPHVVEILTLPPADAFVLAGLVALVTAGAILPHVSGFGPGDGWRDLRNIALRWVPGSVPGAVALTVAGPWWAFVAFPAACALAALAWPALERVAGPTHRLGPFGYTEIAELIAGALVFGSAALLWRHGL